MSDPFMKIHVDPNAKPIAVHKPIPIPHHWQEQVKKDLDRDMKLGIIEKVPMGVPNTWQSRMVMVAKKSGKPRRTVYLVLMAATGSLFFTPNLSTRMKNLKALSN